MRHLAAIFLLAGLAGSASGQPIELAAAPELSNTGHYRVSWTSPGEGVAFSLQEATAEDFADARTIYQGPQVATVVSGKLDGTYHYRIRAGQGPWSEPIEVTVRHRSLTQAFAFMAVGATVFAATAALIVTGHRRHRREMAAGEGEDAA